jgi:hypothetical protein
MAEDSAEALQWFRERLEQLGEQYPELRTSEYRERLEAELRRQREEEGNGHGRGSRNEAGSTQRYADGGSGAGNSVL